jgi:dihydrofolate reductase
MATIFYTASSLDGFIATTDHQLDWLLTRDVDSDGVMGFASFEPRIGALAMGASTYEWLLRHHIADGNDWPYEVPTWVFTHRDLPRTPGRVEFVQGPVGQVHERMLAAAGERDVWIVGGGDLAGQFCDANRLDEIWVQFAPVTLGSGAPLLPRRVELRLVEVARNRDFACVRHEVVRAPHE